MLVPSIDIMDGRVVQLRQGRDLVLSLERDPVDLARELNRYGEVAVIDLDAATGRGDNLELVKRLCRAADCRVGGGIRDSERARELLKAGARRLIFGTAATPELLERFSSDLCMVALDNRGGEVVDRGWTSRTGESVLDRASRLKDFCGSFLVTFVENEGCLGGLDVGNAAELAERLGKPLTVAGGIKDVTEIAELARVGIDAQVGMALYRGIVDPVEAFLKSLNFNLSLRGGGSKCVGNSLSGGDARGGDARASDTAGGDGLIPTVVQDEDGTLLMVAYSSPESLRLALKEGAGIYFSRSRQAIWRKGETSGARQELISCRTDCDRDTLKFTVRQTDQACHTGSYSCFNGVARAREFNMMVLFDTLRARKAEVRESVKKTEARGLSMRTEAQDLSMRTEAHGLKGPQNAGPRATDAQTAWKSYSASLFSDRALLIDKLKEEMAEVIGFSSRDNLRWEIADVIYFLSVLAVDEGLDWKDIELELRSRRGAR